MSISNQLSRFATFIVALVFVLLADCAKAAPLIIAEPTSKAAFVGDTNVVFQVLGGGDPSLTYRWQVQPAGSGSASNIATGTNQILSIANPGLSLDGNKYRCVVSSTGGSATSLFATLNVFAAPAVTPQVTLSSSTIVTTSTASITITVTGLNSGDTIRVHRVLDANGSGKPDLGKPLVDSFLVTDGTASFIGGVRNWNIPGDEDQVAGQITTHISLLNSAELGRTSGTYLIRITSPSGEFAPVTKTLTITQPNYAQSVSGKVMTTASVAVPYAGVFMLTGSGDKQRYAASTVADSAGNYTLRALPGSYTVMALQPGFSAPMMLAPQITLSASATLTAQNPKLAPATCTIVGQVLASDTSSLRGVQLFAQSNNGNMIVATSDVDGNFDLGAVADTWQIDPSEINLRKLGYVPLQNPTTVSTLGGGVQGLQFTPLPVTALIYGKWQDTHNTPLPGVIVNADDNNQIYSASSATDPNGQYVIGVGGTLNTSWWVGPKTNNPALAGYIPPSYQSAFPVSGSASQVNFTVVQPTSHLKGTVTKYGAAVAGASIGALLQASGPDVTVATTTGTDGSFDLGVTAGTWNINLLADYANSNNLVAPLIPETVTDNQTISNIPYQIVNGTGMISGSVKDSKNNPVSTMVSANDFTNGIDYSANGQTDANGNYSFPVISGTWNVTVQQSGYSQATVTVTGSAQVNFTPTPAVAHLTGTVTNNGVPVSGASIATQLHNFGANPEILATTGTDGSFDLGVTSNGTWYIYLPSDYSNSNNLVGPQLSETVTNNQSISNIDFQITGGTETISGNVKDSNGNPAMNVGVNADATISGTDYFAHAQTDTGGNYSLPLVDGTWTVSVPGYNGSVYIPQTVTLTGSSTQVNFTPLAVIAHLTGTVTKNGVAAGGIPLGASLQVQGDYPPILTTTDPSGNFDFGVTTNGTWMIQMQTDYADSNNLVGPALFENVSASQNIAGINFQISGGTGTISGNVKDTNNNPVTQADVSANATINGIYYSADAQTDASGNYSLPVIDGTWTVGVNNLPGYSGTTVDVVGSVQVNFAAMAVTAHLQGTVTNNGVPVSGASIGASQQNVANPLYIPTTTGTDGSFDLGVCGGTWSINLDNTYADNNNLVGPTINETISDGSTISGIAYQVVSGTGTINGSVKDAGNSPLVNANVYAYANINGIDYNAGAQTDSNGNYTFPTILGSWTVNVGLPGFTQQTADGSGSPQVNFVQQAAQRYTLTLASSPLSTGSISVNPSPDPDGKYAAGTIVTLTGSAATGYAFNSWSGDVTGTTNPVQVGMNSNTSVTANFSRPAPPWVTPNGKQYSMIVFAQVQNNGQAIATAPGSLLAAFVNGTCAGVTSVQAGPGNIQEFQLQVWSDQTPVNGLSLKVYDASTGVVSSISETLNFASDSTVGSITTPVIYTTGSLLTLNLVPNWNWLSFNVLPLSSGTLDHSIGTVLGGYSAQTNDLIKSGNGSASFASGKWWPSPGFVIDPNLMYKMQLTGTVPKQLTVHGLAVDASAPLKLVSGWNWIGYTPQQSQPVSAALGGMQALPNDLVKSPDGSASYASGQWWPAPADYQLTPGQGYMLKVATAQNFVYPQAVVTGPGPMPAILQKAMSAPPSNSPGWQNPVGRQYSMMVYAVATAYGQPVATGKGSLLAAFIGGTCAGVVEVGSGPAGQVFQLQVWSDQTPVSGLTLKVYDATMDQTGNIAGTFNFASDTQIGSITTPTTYTVLVPPTVVTGSVNAITSHGGMLTGTVNPNGQATTFGFQYGTTTDYGSRTTLQTAGSGTNAGTFTAGITSLIPATDYHYQIVAANTSGTSFGLDQVFTTGNAAPGATTGTAMVLSYQAVTLTGTAIPFGLPTNVYFQYGTTTAYGLTTGTDSQIKGAGAIAQSFDSGNTITGLKGATLYHYRAVAVNSLGSNYGLDRTFITQNPPPVVTTGGVSNTTGNSTNLIGTANPSGLATSVWFEYGMDTNYGTATTPNNLPATVGALNQTVPITGLNLSTVYHYRIVAANVSGTSWGNDATFTTAGSPIVTTGISSKTTANSAVLSGTVNPCGMAAAYWFEYGAPNNFVTAVPIGGPVTSGTQTGKLPLAGGIAGVGVSMPIASLTPNTTYSYRLVASNTNGTTAGLPQLFTTANAAPAVITGTSIVLSYQAVTLTGTATPHGLPTNVYFQLGTTTAYSLTTGSTQIFENGTNMVPFDSGTAIVGLKGATLYHYRAVSVNSLGITYGADKTFVTLNPPPVVVTGAATRMNASGATLNGTVNPSGLATTAWFESGTDTNYGTPTTPNALAAILSATSQSATIGSLNQSTTYHYRLVAANTSGTSYGNDAIFTTAGLPIAITGTVSRTTANGTTLSGTVNPCWAPTAYYFEYWTPAKTGTTSNLSIASSGIGIGVSAAVLGLIPNTTYSYHLVASNTNGQVTGSDQTFTTAGPPMVGTGPAVSTVAGMLVSGSANANGLPTTVSFKYGKTSAYGSVTVSQSAGTGTNWAPYSATITGLISGTTYHYQIVAVNSSGTVVGLDQTFTTPISAPSIPTVTVSSTGETVATLDASINSQNGATNAYFQYGTTIAYGKTTGTATLTASGSASPLECSLFALLPHTTYHARCVAKNAQGIINSADTTFKTLPRFDMNGDGFSELLVSNTTTGETSLVSIGNATATSGTLTVTGSMAGPSIPLDSAFSGQAEFNQDGTIAWLQSGGTVSQTTFWIPGVAGLSAGWTSASLVTGTFSVPDGSTVSGINDVDGDGNPDLVITGTNQKVTFWLLNGFTVTAQKSGPTLPANYSIVGLDDLNGDGKLDLLLWQSATGKTQIMALNGTALLSTTIGPVIPAGWQLVGVNVFTGTGTPNWLLFNPSTGATQIWMMKGTVRSAILTGPSIPAGFTPLGTK